MKVYGANICIECRNYKAVQKIRQFEAEFVDITENTANLKEFLKIRDHSDVFDEIKKNGGIGIPLFVNCDGKMTLDLNEALAWIGQEPVKENEIAERREEPACSSCR